MVRYYETPVLLCYIMEPTSIAAILPHLEVFGGIRRYLSLGNAWRALGHRVVLFTPAGRPPTWMRFDGEVRPWDAISASPGSGPDSAPFEVAFTPQPSGLP